MEPVYPAYPVYVFPSCGLLCPERVVSHFPHCLRNLYLPSPASEASCRLHQLLKRRYWEYWWGIWTVFRCVSVLVTGCPFLWAVSSRSMGRGLQWQRNSLFEGPWPTPFNLPCLLHKMGRTMLTYVSQLEESGRFNPVSSWLCTSHMLSPPLLTSARQTDLIYPGVAGGCIDDERLTSVLSFLTVQGGVVSLL